MTVGPSAIRDEPSRWQRELGACLAAFGFLTRLPITHRAVPDLARSTAYFPLVGLVVGLCATAAFAVGLMLFGPSIAVVLSVITSVLVTGAFHEDGLADSLDGFGGGWKKDQVLSIMKDSRVGAYALVGIVLMLLLKTAALFTIHEHSVRTLDAGGATRIAMDVWPVARALIAAHVLSRWSSVWLMRTYAYVRPEHAPDARAIGRPFAGAVSAARLATASVLAFLIVALLLQQQAIVPVLAAGAATLAAGRYFARRIGGITGDALGAANQLVEVTVYLGLACRFTPLLSA